MQYTKSENMAEMETRYKFIHTKQEGNDAAARGGAIENKVQHDKYGQ